MNKTLIKVGIISFILLTLFFTIASHVHFYDGEHTYEYTFFENLEKNLVENILFSLFLTIQVLIAVYLSNKYLEVQKKAKSFFVPLGINFLITIIIIFGIIFYQQYFVERPFNPPDGAGLEAIFMMIFFLILLGVVLLLSLIVVSLNFAMYRKERARNVLFYIGIFLIFLLVILLVLIYNHIIPFEGFIK